VAVGWRSGGSRAGAGPAVGQQPGGARPGAVPWVEPGAAPAAVRMRENGAVTPAVATTRADATCAAAVELARATAAEAAGGAVGDHLGIEPDGDRVVTHSFAALAPGYHGWRWAVTLARAPRSRHVTVDEVVLLPAAGALLAPPWVPWSERLRPGDLGVGDLLPTAPDDDRLAPAYVLSDDPAVAQVAAEVGLGRARVMSRLGRRETAERWYVGDGGPDAPIAQHAPGHCGTCGFYLPIAGSLRAMFGVCGNEFAPRDGQVVSADHGCGAHSEALVEAPPPEPTPAPPFDDAALDVEEHAPPAAGATEDAEIAEDAESLGHS
jgi:hypothetical protein